MFIKMKTEGFLFKCQASTTNKKKYQELIKKGNKNI